jgi:thioester reductase-like protein
MTATALDEDDILSESCAKIDAFLPNSAYSVSEFIAELPVTEAVNRGVPFKVFRLSYLSGNRSTRGNTNLWGNHLIVWMLTNMRIGVVPAYTISSDILPVDQAAELSLTLFFHDDARFKMYKVCNPLANDEQEIVDVAEEFGYTVD